MNRKVTYARFHQSVYAPGAGELGNTLPPSSKTLDSLVMTTTDHGLLAEFTFRHIRQEILIPHANVVLMSLAPEEKPAASLKAVKGA